MLSTSGKPGMDTPLIQIQALTRQYGEAEAAVHALAGVDLQVARGEFAAIMGPSGSGKSTLLNILGCLDRPSSGTYQLDGYDVSQLSKNELAEVRSEKLGFIFQSFNLLARQTALANVMLPMLYNQHEDLSDDDVIERAISALESVGLGDRLYHRPNQLSGGQQQRVAIARALVNRPSLILADEPTGNLDSHASAEVLEILHELHRQGTTLIIVTHDPDIAAHAGRIICVKDGRILSDGHGPSSPCTSKEMQ